MTLKTPLELETEKHKATMAERTEYRNKEALKGTIRGLTKGLVVEVLNLSSSLVTPDKQPIVQPGILIAVMTVSDAIWGALAGRREHILKTRKEFLDKYHPS